ncbi:hypothetical protein [uncultured Pseudomonas sp.]|uniref:hypothetical protein n=1 Tax=uncultured Pseudomonas sp. TaxID=114707 RepID=UPI0030DB72AA|tara:strand:+ start:109569 stop:109769 length:201 start_codon:yes stop_codon:yes gene_type:complete
MGFMTTTELMAHHRDLLNSLALLDKAAPGWNKADRERGQATRRNLQQEIGRVEGDLHMAGAIRKQA